MTAREHEESSSDVDRSFQTTHWSLVIGVGQSDTRQHSLTLLCERYWMPLYAYLRRSGHSSHDAQDLTQAFFATLLEKQNAMEGADQSRGRFRSYLLGSLKNFVSNQRTKRRAKKRGGDRVHLSLNYDAAEAWYQYEPVESQTPETVYRRRWALSLLDGVLARLESEYASKGQAELFRVLKQSLTGGSSDVSYEDLARQLSMSGGAVKTAAHRLRQRYRVVLKDEISHTVASQDEVEDEIRQLFNALSS